MALTGSLGGVVAGAFAAGHRGAHFTGLLFVSSLFAFVDPPAFLAAALALPLVGLSGLAWARRAICRDENHTHDS